jgi:ABC-type multidrug transport system ATPase subunit
MDRGDYLVETRGLTKKYGPRIVAVNRVSLTVRRGEVYGFLGPNGAGKTTTLRMLLGLIRPTSGAASVLGRAPGDPEGLTRVGALVESPAFYPYLSGMDNLRVVARYASVPNKRIEKALETVALAGRARDKFATYSLGMKQRLGVAAALLKDPELLVLDEPTNGLDPAGMADMRTLIRRLGSGERTVLLSSHLLGEVEQICDRVGVISHGRLIAENTVEKLRGKGALLVGAQPLERARERVEQLLGPRRVEALDSTLRLDVDPATAGRINRELVSAGVEVSELRPIERTLEEVFLELTDQRGENDVG